MGFQVLLQHKQKIPTLTYEGLIFDGAIGSKLEPTNSLL
jgi:hypothetical protein